MTALVRQRKEPALKRIARAESEQKESEKKGQAVKRQRDAMVRIARETSWHQSISLIGMRMSSDVWVVLRVAQGIELELVDAVRQEINELTDSAFIAMGGQQDKFFEEKGDSTNSLWKTRANQSCVYISSSIRCLVWMATNAEQSLLLQAVLIS